MKTLSPIYLCESAINFEMFSNTGIYFLAGG